MTAAPSHASDWIHSGEALHAWLAALPDHAVVGMDTEFMRRDTYYPQLALLQLGHAGRYALVDPTAFKIGTALQESLQQRELVAVMHSASEDLEALTDILPDGPPRLYDTQIAASLAGLGLSLSYRALVEIVAGVVLDKGETRSDWLQRPLTEAQRGYATLDVVYLQDIRQHLDQRLSALGRHAWLDEECNRLKQRSAGRHADPQPQRSLRPAAEWPVEQQALLRRLLLWREQTARDINRPKTWLLDEPLALSLAQHPPRSRSELEQRSRGMRALRSAQREALSELLQPAPTDAEIAATEPVLGLPQGEAKRALASMKQVIDAEASRLDLPAGLLCPRKVLEDYVLSRQVPALFDGWRGPILADALASRLP
ncbi:ribonuclease D [Frateuria aurantia]